jgi:hypothetical protein
MIATEELLALYAAIERGEVRLSTRIDPQALAHGLVVYEASNGWSITIFNDANEFDYVSVVRAPDGRTITYGEIADTSADWEPSDEVAWRCFGIPGTDRYRCPACGAFLRDEHDPTAAVQPPFLCGGERCDARGEPHTPTTLGLTQ